MFQNNCSLRFTIQSCVVAALLAVQASTVSAVTTDQLWRGAELVAAFSRIFAVPAAYVQPTAENKPTLAKRKVLADVVRVTSDVLMLFNHKDESFTTPLYNGLWASVDTGCLIKHICDVFDPEVESVSLPQDVALDPETNATVEKILTSVKPVLPVIECFFASWIAWLGLQNDHQTIALRVRLQSCLSLTRTVQVWSDNCHEPNKRYYFALVAAHVAIILWEFFLRTIEDKTIDQVKQARALLKGINKDEKQAVELLQQAADLGNGDAMFELALCYYLGNGVTQDETQRWYWMEQAANHGNGVSMLALGLRYKQGMGVEVDNKRAVEWFEKAADSGFAKAIDHLRVLANAGNGEAQQYLVGKGL